MESPIDTSEGRHHWHLEIYLSEVRYNPARPRTLKGLTVQFTLQVDQQGVFTLIATDEFGNTTTLGTGTPTVTVADTTIVGASFQTDGTLLVIPTGKLGQSDVTVTDVIGSTTLTGVIHLTTIPGAAAAISFIAGTTLPNPVPAPPVTTP